jgi:hypothetical protein
VAGIRLSSFRVVGNADRSRRDRAADEAGEGEHGDDVGQHLQQLVREPEPWSAICSASAAPNSRHAAAAPSGVHLPTIIAASAM